jgi:hypothetical protein
MYWLPWSCRLHCPDTLEICGINGRDWTIRRSTAITETIEIRRHSVSDTHRTWSPTLGYSSWNSRFARELALPRPPNRQQERQRGTVQETRVGNLSATRSTYVSPWFKFLEVRPILVVYATLGQ